MPARVVILATRVELFGFAEYVAVIVPLPDPAAVTVHHVWSLVTVQLVLDVTVKLAFPAGAATFWFGGVTVNDGAAPDWVTVTITGVRPITVVVTLAIRVYMVGLSVKLAVIVPLPDPEAVTVHHV